MRNRAKCKKCQSIIESTLKNEYVSCPCGEISIAGGSVFLRAKSVDFTNFLRIDDEGNEIVVEYRDMEQKASEPPELTRDDLMKMMEEMINKIKDLPPVAMSTSINHYDYLSLLMILYSILQK